MLTKEEATYLAPIAEAYPPGHGYHYFSDGQKNMQPQQRLETDGPEYG